MMASETLACFPKRLIKEVEFDGLFLVINSFRIKPHIQYESAESLNPGVCNLLKRGAHSHPVGPMGYI